MRVISGRPLEKVEGLALKSGWPVWLLDFKPAIYHPDSLRLLMTLLIVLRGVKLKAVLDLEPITKPWGGSDPISNRELHFAARQLGIRRLPTEWKRFHMSTKKGPIGQALLTAVTELTLLPQELIDDIRLLGGTKLGELIDHLQKPMFAGFSLVDLWARIFPARRTLIRKISYFSDKEGKTRVIAILDYWSQTCLRPLHDTLNRVLKKIRTDCTFNQNHFLSCLPSVGPYYSIDLSNATDRMPVALQQRVVSLVVGEARAAAWVRVLTGYEYLPTGQPVPVKYGAGQPMGAYSSWCAMALTHHVLVKVAAARAGYPHFWKYALLGDDLVIANAAVATEYRALLQVLDMPVSEAKTHVSYDTYEFAKRWIHAGTEITGFSISGLKSVWKRYSLLHSFLQSQLHHGWNLPTSEHPDLIAAIYGVYGRPQHAERATKLYMVFDSLAKAKATGDFSVILYRVAEWFPGRLESWNLQAFAPEGLNATAKAVLVEAKSRLVKRDLEKFQVDAYKVNDRLNTDFEQVCKDLGLSGLSGQEYRASLRVCHPMVVVLNYLVDGALPLIMTMLDPEADLVDFYLEAGLSKYHVSKGVFSMRASHSINLAQSMVVKSVLDVCKDAGFSRGSALMLRP